MCCVQAESPGRELNPGPPRYEGGALAVLSYRGERNNLVSFTGTTSAVARCATGCNTQRLKGEVAVARHATPLRYRARSRVLLLAGLALAAVVAVALLVTRPGHQHPAPQRLAGSPTRTVAAVPTFSTAASPGLLRSRPATPAHSTASPAPRNPTLVYTVHPGDNLTVIAAWFKARGFQPVYAWNRTVIGQDPNLIFPGQRIIVVPGGPVRVAVGKPTVR
jgi:hypothetical protein